MVWLTPISRAISLHDLPSRSLTSITTLRARSSLARGDAAGGGGATGVSGLLTGPPLRSRRSATPASRHQLLTDIALAPVARAASRALLPPTTSDTARDLNSIGYVTRTTILSRGVVH